MVQMIEDENPNRIVELFNDKTILITGGTGFLGKVLVEKLLRICPNLKKIYLIMREKKGKNIEERLQEIFSGPLFDMLKQRHGKCIFEKVEPIQGDISVPNLGISDADRRKLTTQTEIIYHSAATVQFDDPFKRTVLLNVRGTREMLALARDCKKLMVFGHLSTAYCQETQEVLYEKTYPPPADPHRIIEICEWMDEKTLDIIADHIRGPSANNYTFTKALGEGLVTEQMDNLPVIIQRPSAVIPIWKDPLPGWTDNINGPTGLMIGAGKGVIRTMYGQKDYFADYVSVDLVANCLMCTTYDYVTHKSRRVYNMTASDEIRVTFEEIIQMGRNIIDTRVAFDWVLWYPGGSIHSSRIMHLINFFLFQLLPAFFVDMILFMFGYKPFLLRVQKKIWRGYKIFEYYSNRRWEFKHNNVEQVRDLMNRTERKVFKMDSEGFNYYDYFTNCTYGARRFLMREPDEGVPAALKRMKILWFVDRLIKTIFFIGLTYLLYKNVATFIF